MNTPLIKVKDQYEFDPPPLYKKALIVFNIEKCNAYRANGLDFFSRKINKYLHPPPKKIDPPPLVIYENSPSLLVFLVCFFVFLFLFFWGGGIFLSFLCIMYFICLFYYFFLHFNIFLCIRKGQRSV